MGWLCESGLKLDLLGLSSSWLCRLRLFLFSFFSSFFSFLISCFVLGDGGSSFRGIVRCCCVYRVCAGVQVGGVKQAGAINPAGTVNQVSAGQDSTVARQGRTVARQGSIQAAHRHPPFCSLLFLGPAAGALLCLLGVSLGVL